MVHRSKVNTGLQGKFHRYVHEVIIKEMMNIHKDLKAEQDSFTINQEELKLNDSRAGCGGRVDSMCAYCL